MPTGVKLPPIEQIVGSIPVLPTGTVLVKNADTGVAVSIYNDRGMTSLLSASGLTTVTRGQTVGYSAPGVTWAIYVTPAGGGQVQQGPFYFEANLGTVSADVAVFDTRLDSVESGTITPTGATDTDTVTYEAATTSLRPLRRDWRDVEEFSGTDAAKLAAAALQCATDGKIMRWKRGKTYSLATTLDLSSALAVGKLHMETEGAEILKTAAVYAIRADGTESAKINLTANVPAGSFTVTLPTGQGVAGAWAKGDIFAVEDASDVFGPDVGATVKYIRAREQHEVYKVVGDVLTLAGPIIFGYTTANGARYSKKTMGGQLIVRGGLQIRAGDPSYTGHAAYLNNLRDPLTDDISTYDHPGGLIHRECMGGIAMRYEARHNPASANPWYYNHVFVGACMDTRVIGYTVRGGESEASCTTLSDERAPTGSGIDATDPDSPNGDTFWGGPIDCTIAHGDVQLGSLGTCYGSHAAGLNNTFENCKARGGNVSFVIRDIGRKLTGGCTGRGSSGRAINQTSSAEDTQIIGGEFSWSTTEGVALSAPRSRVVGVYLHHLGTVGINVAGDDSEILNTTIMEAGTIGPGNYAIQCSGGNRKRIAGCNLPKGTTQAVAVLNAGATDRVTDNDCYGYGTSSPFTTPTAGSIIARNGVDAMRTLTGASTLTVPHDGPFRLNVGTGQVDNITATGWAGREVTFILNGSVTFAHFSGGTGNLRIGGSANFAGTASDTITLACDGTNWFEKSRAVI